MKKNSFFNERAVETYNVNFGAPYVSPNTSRIYGWYGTRIIKLIYNIN